LTSKLMRAQLDLWPRAGRLPYRPPAKARRMSRLLILRVRPGGMPSRAILARAAARKSAWFCTVKDRQASRVAASISARKASLWIRQTAECSGTAISTASRSGRQHIVSDTSLLSVPGALAPPIIRLARRFAICCRASGIAPRRLDWRYGTRSPSRSAWSRATA
jgi:hypothetical protein